MTAALSELLKQLTLIALNQLFVFFFALVPRLKCFFSSVGAESEVRGHSRRSAKGSVPVWLLGRLHVHTCLSNTFVSYWSFLFFFFFSLRAIFLGALKSGPVWAGQLWYKTFLLFYLMFYISIYRYKFCCKMHMQMFCTEVATLPAGWGHGRRQAFLAWGGKRSAKRFDVCSKTEFGVLHRSVV